MLLELGPACWWLLQPARVQYTAPSLVLLWPAGFFLRKVADVIGTTRSWHSTQHQGDAEVPHACSRPLPGAPDVERDYIVDGTGSAVRVFSLTGYVSRGFHVYTLFHVYTFTGTMLRVA